MHGVLHHLGGCVGQFARAHTGLRGLEILHDAAELFSHVVLVLKTSIELLAKLPLLLLGLRFQGRLLPFVRSVRAIEHDLLHARQQHSQHSQCPDDSQCAEAFRPIENLRRQMSSIGRHRRQEIDHVNHASQDITAA